ncbi:MAG: hypothetical protein CVU77_05970 [Elusimicrobia bacterium HGW-Elusimicrobia-1]|jgi:tetratricopeptide (TPR) repeat protein|nr:MAG: hypothetical protein CVU79_08420 [Elusimicrobia bacterium HGW-Elusimicrobia-3]PKN01226.1 MAG: hypothetical protein CVU77_05970 [Elusimicrobia bacterium HGW-Elusimicrobia-1]
MNKIVASAAVFLAVTALYVRGLSPTITSDDSGELAGVAHTLGVAHSPGYPVYSLTGGAAKTLLPLANPAYRANLVSAISSAAGVTAAFFFFAAVSGSSAAGFWAALALGASALFYGTATVTEVYGLSIFFSAAMLWALSSGMEAGKKLRLAFFVWGLSFVSHYIAAFWLPAIFYFAWKEKRVATRDIASYAFFGALGMTPLLLIPVRAAAGAVYSWEDPSTAARFLDVVLRSRYGAAKLAQGEMNLLDISPWIPKLRFLVSELISSFSPAGFLTGCAGLLLSFIVKKNKTSDGKDKKTAGGGIFLFLLFIGAGPAFLAAANVGVDRNSSALLSRFLYLAGIAWCTYIAIALARLKDARVIAAAGIILTAAAVNGSAVKNSSRYHFTFYDYACNLLKNTPPDSLVIFDRADEMEFCVSYLLRIAGKRPDIDFLDANAGVSKSVYGVDYYKIWGAGRLALRNKIESALIENASAGGRRVVYATFLPAQTVTPKTPRGLLHISRGEKIPAVFPDEIFVLRPPEKEIRSEGIYASHFLILGDYYAAAGDAKRAARNFKTAFWLDNPGAYHRLGYFYFERGDYSAAADTFGKLLRFYPRDADARLNLGVISEKFGRLDEAEIFYREAAIVEPSNARAHYNLGALEWKRSRWREAAKAFGRAASIEPSNEEYRRFAVEAAAKSK